MDLDLITEQLNIAFQLPENIKSKLPKYPIPIARIGRLAVDKDYKGQGIDGFLLHDAFTNILRVADHLSFVVANEFKICYV